MKKIYILILSLSSIILTSCESGGEEVDCGTTVISGSIKQLNLGPQGGCFYVNDNGNKSYVDRSECRC